MAFMEPQIRTGPDVPRMTGTGKTIVAVDDSADNRMLIKGILQDAGFVVFDASNGAECLAVLNRVKPRLILLDIQMPGMNGFDLCRRIRQDAALRQVPVAFLT